MIVSDVLYVKSENEDEFKKANMENSGYMSNSLSAAQISAKILSSAFFSDLVRKESSPQIRINLRSTNIIATIDEGSELDCISDSLVSRLKLKFLPMKSTALAAGSLPLQLLGILTSTLVIKAFEKRGYC